MRKDFEADWAIGISGALGNLVQKAFPRDLRSWPLLQSYSFEGYALPDNYAVFALRDQLQGIVSGAGSLHPFPHSGHPKLPPRVEDIELWQHYLRNKLNLREEDAPFLVPIHDSGMNLQEDYKLFDAAEKFFWDRQLMYVAARHATYLSHSEKQLASLLQPQAQSQSVTNISAGHYYKFEGDNLQAAGDNARINIDSTDSSVNIAAAQVFDHLRRATNEVLEPSEREKIMAAIGAMERAHGSPAFVAAYKDFVAIVSGHMTIFMPLMAALADLLI